MKDRATVLIDDYTIRPAYYFFPDVNSASRVCIIFAKVCIIGLPFRGVTSVLATLQTEPSFT